MKMKTVIAWTGGSAPKKMLLCSEDEKVFRSYLFRTQMAMVKEFWGDCEGLCNTVLDMARVQYVRAKYDAHATFRNDNE